MMGNDIFFLPAQANRQGVDVSANPRALRTSGLNLENSDMDFPVAPPRASSADYDRTHRDRACIRPVSLLRNGQKANDLDRARARSLRRDLRSVLMRGRSSG